jgi:hypothetical protein
MMSAIPGRVIGAKAVAYKNRKAGPTLFPLTLFAKAHGGPKNTSAAEQQA